MPRTAIIACDVFLEELNALLPPDVFEAVSWLEMGLHDRPDELRATIQAEISNLEEAFPELENILLAYGLCGNGLAGITAPHCNLIIPRAHDCISILLGSTQKHTDMLRENPATYFYSPGWIRGRRVPGPDRRAYLEELYRPRYPDDPEMVEELIEIDEESFAHHNCAAYVDLTENQEARAYCQNCARHLHWEFKHLPGDRLFLQQLIDGPWEFPRFAVAKPGQRFMVGPDGLLIARAE